MAQETRTVRRFKSVGTFSYIADFSQSASQIKVRFDGHDEDAWQSVPFQVADTGHSRNKAEKMIADYFR